MLDMRETWENEMLELYEHTCAGVSGWKTLIRHEENRSSAAKGT